MFKRLTDQEKAICVMTACGLLGAFYTYSYMLNKIERMKKQWLAEMIKMKKQWIDEVNVRSDLLNWMIEEGIYMDGEEFFPAYQEKAKFINIITEHTT